jgi:hypothetical protein
MRVPHISPGFGEMWELTDASAIVPVVLENLRSRTVNSHIWPKPGQIWGTLVRGRENNSSRMNRGR